MCVGQGMRDAMRIAETVTFGGSGLDRAAAVRDDPDAIARLWRNGRVLPFWRGKPLIRLDMLPEWLVSDHPVLSTATATVFLGRDGDDAYFACDLPDWSADAAADLQPGFADGSLQRHPAIPGEMGFHELRLAMTHLTPRAAELLATGKALLQWHASHGFCASCGQASIVAKAGWQRTCPACDTAHFPRTDPVVIMLVLRENRLLLGRSPGWPEGMYSLLAGFVEPGETLEAAVRREVAEESGIRVGNVKYLASQPWPFPASLMFGCRAEALTDAITLDPVELEHALWVSREDLLLVMAGQHPVIRPPRAGAIAQFLMSAWLADTLD
jgi:NAD+ diphosphatase